MRKMIQAAAFGVVILFGSTTAMAEEGVCKTVKPTAESIRMTLHAHYLPNFIPVVVNNEKALNLSAEQCQAFNKFRTEKAPNGKKLVEQINKLEAESHELALKGASLDEIKQRHQKIAELREKLIVGKMKCRGFIQKTLTKEQYQKLITEVYPAMRDNALAKIGIK